MDPKETNTAKPDEAPRSAASCNGPALPGPRSANGRFKPGFSGNPRGMKRGSKHRVTALAERILAEDAEACIREVVAAALDRDPTAMRLIFERLVPARKGGRVALDLPSIETLGDLRKAQSSIIAAMAQARISPDEAQLASAVLEGQRKLIETIELEQRLSALELRQAEQSE